MIAKPALSSALDTAASCVTMSLQSLPFQHPRDSGELPLGALEAVDHWGQFSRVEFHEVSVDGVLASNYIPLGVF